MFNYLVVLTGSYAFTPHTFLVPIPFLFSIGLNFSKSIMVSISFKNESTYSNLESTNESVKVLLCCLNANLLPFILNNYS